MLGTIVLVRKDNSVTAVQVTNAKSDDHARLAAYYYVYGVQSQVPAMKDLREKTDIFKVNGLVNADIFRNYGEAT